MTANPLVSIAINNYNYGRFLKQAIDSALNQTYSHIEVVVVDDGSTDNSREIIASYGDKVVPILKANGGQASAFNAGFSASRGEIICFLDADDMFLPEKVASVVEVLGNSSERDWCFHPLTLVNAESESIESETENSLSNSLQEYDLRARIQRGKADKHFPYTSTSGLAMRRSLLSQIFPMPEAKGISLNDGYLTFASLGLSPGVVLNKQLGLYRMHSSNAHAMRKDKQRVTARVTLNTAYWIKEKFPSLRKIANSLMATAIGIFQRNGGMDSEHQKLVDRYLSSITLSEKLEIYLRATYNYLKNPKY
jgi:glycosyltransferase involved in cell wall biosynthesis